MGMPSSVCVGSGFFGISFLTLWGCAGRIREYCWLLLVESQSEDSSGNSNSMEPINGWMCGNAINGVLVVHSTFYDVSRLAVSRDWKQPMR